MRVTFAAVGDMMLGTDYPENHLPDDDGLGFLANVAPVLSAVDVAFGNLEGVLMDGGEPAKKCSNAECVLPVPLTDPLRGLPARRRVRRNEPCKQPRARLR